MLVKQGFDIKRSRISEVLAALLGYKTLAALQIEEADASLDYHLEDAERFVLNLPAGTARSTALHLPEIAVEACIKSLKEAMTIPVHSGVTELYDEYAREALEETIANGEFTSMATADSNASFPDYPHLNDEVTVSGDLWGSPSEWSIEASGVLYGEYDPEGDRMYNGHQFNVWGKLIFAKAGRAGLIHLDSEDGASSDESWRDDEFMT